MLKRLVLLLAVAGAVVACSPGSTPGASTEVPAGSPSVEASPSTGTGGSTEASPSTGTGGSTEASPSPS